MAQPNTYNHLEVNNTDGGIFCSYSNLNGAKIAVALRRIFPNQSVSKAQEIELVMTGPLEGSILCETPKVFSISCGEVPEGATDKQRGIAGVWDAENGDIVISAPKGSVRIIAENIELISNGDQKETGHVSVFANGMFRTDSDKIQMDSDETVIKAEGEMNLTAMEHLQMDTGHVVVNEGSDAVKAAEGAIGGGSKTPFQWAESVEKLLKSIRDITGG